MTMMTTMMTMMVTVMMTMTMMMMCLMLISALSVTFCNSGPISDQRKGPTAERKIAEEHFVIVGAGVAGLTSALLLLQAGHRWEFLRSRVSE